MLLATKVLVGFLRGQLTNLDTPPVASDIRSILVRPRIVKDFAPLSADLDPFIIRRTNIGSSTIIDNATKPHARVRLLFPDAAQSE